VSGPEVLIPMTLFLSVASVLILRGPLGKALADRLAGRVSSGDSDEASAVRGELADVHQRLEELELRVDFAERLLVSQREREGLPGGGG